MPSTGTPSNLPFVANKVGGKKAIKVHSVLIDGTEVPPTLWRAKCGFRFAFAAFTRHASLAPFDASMRCKKCGLNSAAGAESDKSSSSDSSASSS